MLKQVQHDDEVLGWADPRLIRRPRHLPARRARAHEPFGARHRQHGLRRRGAELVGKEQAAGAELVEDLRQQRLTEHEAALAAPELRSEEHTSELQSLMRISYAVFCLKKKKQINTIQKQQSRKKTEIETIYKY